MIQVVITANNMGYAPSDLDKYSHLVQVFFFLLAWLVKRSRQSIAAQWFQKIEKKFYHHLRDKIKN